MTTIEQAKYLLSRSDVEAAIALFQRDKEWVPSSLIDYIHKYWPSMFGEYDRVYKEAGEIEALNTSAFVHIPHEARYQWLLNYLKQYVGLKFFYNYGASRCLYDIHLSNEIGGVWYCEDIDSMSIKEAASYINLLAKDPDSFIVQTASQPLPGERDFDCVICMEVLEHVLNPVEILNALENNVKDGGKMIVSVPYGPIEYTMWVNNPQRNREHTREFNQNELIQLFGNKPKFELYQLKYGEDIGCHIICFTVTDERRGFDAYEIDWEGKLSEAKEVSLPGLEV